MNHCLLALPGTRREDIKRVMSHPQVSVGDVCAGAAVISLERLAITRFLTRMIATQALSQCDGYLTRMGVIKEAVDDTAGAAKTIAANKLRCVLCVWRRLQKSDAPHKVPACLMLTPCLHLQGLRRGCQLPRGRAVRSAGTGHKHSGRPRQLHVRAHDGAALCSGILSPRPPLCADGLSPCHATRFS